MTEIIACSESNQFSAGSSGHEAMYALGLSHSTANAQIFFVLFSFFFRSLLFHM